MKNYRFHPQTAHSHKPQWIYMCNISSRPLSHGKLSRFPRYALPISTGQEVEIFLSQSFFSLTHRRRMALHYIEPTPPSHAFAPQCTLTEVASLELCEFGQSVSASFYALGRVFGERLRLVCASQLGRRARASEAGPVSALAARAAQSTCTVVVHLVGSGASRVNSV